MDKYVFKLDYHDHQAVVFTSVGKNVALTIALVSVVFGSEGILLAVYPAVMSLFQLLFLISYLHLRDHLEKWWVKR